MTVDAGVFFRFLIAALATWRLAFLVARERGPWDIFGRFRRGAGRVVGDLVSCIKCVGVWVAIPFAFSCVAIGWNSSSSGSPGG
jgi:hypothetical protein